jgi:hypothetical protein
VVQEPDIYELQGVSETSSDGAVCCAGLRVAAGMIVSEHDGCGVPLEGSLDHLARMD